MMASQQPTFTFLEGESSESILPDLDLPNTRNVNSSALHTQYSEPFSQLSFSELVDVKVEVPDFCTGMEEETIVPFSLNVDALDSRAQNQTTSHTVETANDSHSFNYPRTRTRIGGLRAKSSSGTTNKKCTIPLPTVLKRKRGHVEHSVDKPIQLTCSVCSIEFCNGNDLTNHMRLHAAYTCRFVQCNDAFESTALRQRHELIHVQEIAMAEAQEIDVKPDILSLSATSNSKPPARNSKKTKMKPKPSKPVQRNSANSKPRAARKPKSTSRKNTVISRKTKQVKSSADGTGTTLKIPYVLLERLPETPGSTVIPSLTSTRSKLVKEPSEYFVPAITQTRLRARRDTPSPDNYEDHAAEISPSESETGSNCSPKSHRVVKSDRTARNERRKRNESDDLAKHAKTKVGQCDLCNRCIGSKGALSRHMKTHSIPPETRHKCRHCTEAFPNRSRRADHERREHPNSNVKSYVCSHCNKEFQKQSHLTQHVRIHTGEKPYQCRHCDIRFGDTTQRVRHEKRVHNGGATRYKCELCDHQADAPYALAIHNRTHTGERPFECEFEDCKKTFTMKSHLVQHARIHTGVKSFQCRYCDEQFIDTTRRKRHERMAHPDKVEPQLRPFDCDQCGKSFLTSNQLEEHIRTHTGEKPFTCNLCVARFARKQALLIHLRSHAGVKPYPCKECPARFTTPFGRLSHWRNKHTTIREFLCEYCSRTFNNKGKLKVHTRIHTGEKTFSCTICELKFTYSFQLKCHNMKIHPSPEDKHFICEYCGRSFWRQCNYDMHVLTHTGEKPFVCEVCGKAFRRKQMLDNHTRLHTGETFDCEHCEKKFIDKRNYKNHLFIHSTLKPYGCSICDALFLQDSSRRRHEARVHGKPNPAATRRSNKNSTDKQKTGNNSARVGEKPYRCVECDARFFSQENMKRHVEIKHSIVKNFKCQYCPRRFETRLLKHRHERTHSKYNATNVERPFKCEVIGCGRSYSTKMSLNLHNHRMHTSPEDKKIVCQYCQKRFYREHEYRRHVQIHIAGKIFQCNQCEKSYTQHPHLLAHKRVHSGDIKPFKCFTCKEEFVRSTYLRKHILKHHCPTQEDNSFASCSDYMIPEVHFSEGDNPIPAVKPTDNMTFVVPSLGHSGQVGHSFSERSYQSL